MLEIKNLTKRYANLRGVSDVSFTLEKGKILSYLGHNGAGKTTTLRCIIGLLKADSGSFYFNGNSFSPFLEDSNDIKKKFGVVLDIPAFYNNLSAMENLYFFGSIYGLTKKDTENNSIPLLKALEIFEYKDEKVKKYSKGMMQKLSLVRALIHKPEFLIMDEPMSGLDPQSRLTIRNLLLDLSKNNNIGIFITSHDLDEIEKITDEIMILENGRIVISGDVSKLKNNVFLKKKYILVFETDNKTNIDLMFKELNCPFNLEGSKINFETDNNIDLESINNLCAKYSIKLLEFSKKEHSLEDIYFKILERNEK
ncbi:MAG: ABC transporter ATP-binding protein [Elusimicrobia bacterium]|nr:ABC transporter ATP-binding protein [Elusimicrobiota bacterium]